jgi:beta-lactamase regulating signal transducer with metallopeptidase domain
MMKALFDLGERMIWSGGGVLLKGALLLALAGLAVRLCRRSSAAARHLLWTLGLAGVAVVTVAAWLLPGWTLQSPGWVPLPAEGGAGAGAPGVFEYDAAAGGAAAGAVAAGASALSLPPWWPLALAGLWALVALVLLGRVALDQRAAGALVRRSAAIAGGRLPAILRALGAERGMARLPELRASSEIDGPATIGLLRPVILLPVHAGEWGAAELRAVLAHELAHARRLDCATQVLARVACALHWPNPLAWWAARRLLAEREMAADDAALRDGRPATDYAGLLLSLVQAAGSVRPALRGALPMTDGSPLGERIARLLDPARSRAGVSRRALGLGTGGLLAVALGLGCLGASEPRDEGPAARVPAAAPVATGVSAGQSRLWVAMALDESQLGRRLAEADESEGPDNGILRQKFTWKLESGALAATEHLEGAAVALRALVARVLAAQPASARETVLLDVLPGGQARTVVVDLTTRIDLERPDLVLENDDLRRPHIGINLGPADAERMARLTGANIGRRLALVAGEDRLLAAPMVRSTVRERAVITFGASTEAEARALAESLGVRGGPVVFPKTP